MDEDDLLPFSGQQLEITGSSGPLGTTDHPSTPLPRYRYHDDVHYYDSDLDPPEPELASLPGRYQADRVLHGFHAVQRQDHLVPRGEPGPLDRPRWDWSWGWSNRVGFVVVKSILEWEWER